MVYVSVDFVIVRKKDLILGLSIMGYRPSECIEAMSFLTNVFKKMVFDYSYCEKMLRVLGYHISELSKDKIYVGTIPSVDTQPDCIFVDVNEGAFTYFTHAYVLSCDQGTEGSLCMVRGANIYNGTTYYVKAEFYERPRRETQSCYHDVENIKGYVHSEDLHIGVCPTPKYLEQKRRLKLIKQALELANPTWSRPQAGGGRHGRIG